MRRYRSRTMGYHPTVMLKKASARKKRVKPLFFKIVRTAFWGTLILLAMLLVNRLIVYIGQTSYLAANDIHFEGCQKVSPQDLMTMAQTSSNTSLFGMNLKNIAKQLKKNPWVKDVTIKRSFPQGLTIKVREREPVALVADEGLFMVDKDAVVFKEVEKSDLINLPVITGFSLRGKDASILNEVLELLRTGHASGVLPRDSISEVHVDKDYGFTLYTLQDAVPIKLGFADYHKKLMLLASIRKDLQNRNITAAAIQFLSADKAHISRASSS